MGKPLFRWTVGSCQRQGIDILIESVRRTTDVLGADRWDWLICHNGLSQEEIDYLRNKVAGYPVSLFEQEWSMCPIDDECQSPRRADGTYQWNGNHCGGTMWKICPPRMRMNAHEIIMDNDVVLQKKFPQIDEWLASQGKTLILEEPIRFYGRYEHLFDRKGPHLNSGFIGLPPNYDFGGAVLESWLKQGKLKKLTQADEQGLLTWTLNQMPSVRIKASQMIEVLHRDIKHKYTGGEEGIHFTQSNRIPRHPFWRAYQQANGLETE